MTSIASALVQSLLLCLWAGVVALRASGSLPQRRATLVTTVLALAAVWAHVDFFRWHGGERIHKPDMFVYYMTTKYFPEIGYTGLYEATAVADASDALETSRRETQVRSLRDYRLVPRDTILAGRDGIVGRFEARRWESFRRDLAGFRDGLPPEYWASLLWDHGYNGTPLTTAVYGAIARALPVPVFLAVVPWLDPLLVGACAVAVGLVLGGWWGWSFLFLFAANPLNDYHVIGGSFLRYPHYVLATLAVLAYGRGRTFLSGGLLAAATHLRVTPGVFALALAGHDLLTPRRRESLRADRPVFVAFAAVGIALVLPTLAVRAPESSVWSAFRQKIALHGETPGVNHIGLRYPFLYSTAGNVASLQRAAARGEAADWRESAAATFARRRPAFLATALGVLALTAVFLRRAAKGTEALLAGLALLYTLLLPSHYDFMLLGLIPLFFPAEPRMAILTGLSLAAVGGVRALALAEVMDTRFLAQSLVVGATLVGLMAAKAFSAPAGEERKRAGDRAS